MKSVGEIVRERREAAGMTMQALADAAGMAKSYVSMLENHRLPNPPSRDMLRRIERALGITDGELARAADWQNTPPEVREQVVKLAEERERARGLAEWIKANTTRKAGGGKNLDHLWRTGALSRRLRDALGDADRPGPRGSRSGDVAPVAPLPRRVPLINKVAAGYPSDFTDLGFPARIADEYVYAPSLNDPDAFAATVLGESMLPEYREGDVVIFSPAADIADGCDCFVRLEPDHECTFKRIYLEDGGQNIRLQPLNPKFPPRTVDREQVAGLYRAVQCIKKL